MEDSRKGKRGRKKKILPTPNPHVDEENGKKAIVYNTNKEKKWGRGKKEVGKGKRKKKRKMKELSTLNHSIRAYPRRLSI